MATGQVLLTIGLLEVGGTERLGGKGMGKKQPWMHEGQRTNILHFTEVMNLFKGR